MVLYLHRPVLPHNGLFGVDRFVDERECEYAYEYARVDLSFSLSPTVYWTVYCALTVVSLLVVGFVPSQKGEETRGTTQQKTNHQNAISRGREK